MSWKVHLSMSDKDAFEVADKNGLQSSHHMSSHDSSQISGGGFFRLPEVFWMLYILKFYASISVEFW